MRIMHNHKDMYALPAYIGSVAYQIVRALGLPLKFRILAGSKFSEVLSIVPLYSARVRPLTFENLYQAPE